MLFLFEMDQRIGKFVVITDLENQKLLKNEKGQPALFDSHYEAGITCGMVETEHAFICEIKGIHNEADHRLGLNAN